MAKQIKAQPNRATAHPFWQVRCKRHYVTEQGYNDVGFVIMDEGEEVYKSWHTPDDDFFHYVEDNYSKWLSEFVDEYDFLECESREELFLDNFNFETGDLPSDMYRVYVQEIEEVVSTHLTEHDANWFITRKQHDYPKLYTYVESAYWSPQIKKLQGWLESLV